MKLSTKNGNRTSVSFGTEDNREEIGLKKVHLLSNRYFNEGLKRAKIRDLSGAILFLKNSLKCNKANTDARNLLGLIYSEMGETVFAISEWVISSHFKEEENEALFYLSYFQTNPTRLELANRVIKKFNQALKAAHTDSEDLAIIQLKKVVNLNPHHLKSLQLLGLLNLKNGDWSAAKKYLEMAQKIDVTNPMTLLYLGELKEGVGESSSKKETKGERVLFADSDSFAPASYYKEDKPSILPWINLVIGIALGAAFFAVAMLPGIKAKSIESKKAEIIALSETLAEANASIHNLSSEKEELQKKVEILLKQSKNQVKETSEKEKKEEDKDMESLISAMNFYVMGDEKQAAENLIKVKKEKLKEAETINLYVQLSSKLFEKESSDLFIKGRDLYNNGRFDLALPELTKSLEMNPLNVDSMYFIGRTHHRLGEKEKAKEWYEKVIKEFENSARANEAKQKLKQLGGN